MKPLFKYPGGKYKEFEKIKDYFPQRIDDYFEPFFGGGGIYFNLYNYRLVEGTNHINDYSVSLINFYKSVCDDSFVDDLTAISDAWDFIKVFGDEFASKYGDKFSSMLSDKSEDNFIDDDMKEYIKSEVSKCKLNFHSFSLCDKIVYCLNDKLNRFVKKTLDDAEENTTYKCITTGICQAFYFTIRDMYNDWNNNGGGDFYTPNEKSAQWLFIREFCFGSMFRFNPDGDFNIPYGGYAYNNKGFKCKIDSITSKKTRELFKKTDIVCGDFEDFIRKYSYGENDFMFLDPPYDSTFTDYDGNGFGKDEHIRLHKVLSECKCKWLMDIGKTDFILDLYKDFYIVEMNKTYMYQARGTYDNKHTSHLIITNYNPGVLF